MWARRCVIGGIAGALVAVGAPRSEAAVSFTPGQGLAGGQVAAVVFRYGGAGLGFSVASASGEYQDGTASASASMIESGFLTLVSGLKTCGQKGFPSALLPPTSHVTTNSNGNTAPVQASNPGTAGQGSSQVTARPNADGDASIVGAGMSIPGLVTATGGAIHTRAVTSAVAQRRTSVVDLGEGDVSLLGGIVQLHGLHWHAMVEVTGADSRSDRRQTAPAFDAGSVAVAGITMPFPRDAAGLASLNALLLPLGVQLRVPEVRSERSGGVSRTTVGPLTVALGGRTALGPVLHQLAGNLPAIEAALKPGVFDPSGCNELAGLLKPVPQANSTWNLLATGYPIIAAALVGSVDGGGELDLNLGGAQASIDDSYYPPSAIGSPVFATSGPSVAETQSAPHAAVPVPAPGAGPLGALPPTVLAVHRQVECRTTSPVGRPMCWGGHAATGAAAVAALTVALLAGDETVRRRRARRRQEVT